ncbi:MAG: DNA repair protein RadC [Candidatus Gracilibacteria bacterium]|jgi:DNA repair protein RadC|nr:DNA repair protein RadC [Candidatus Gracilibacteria bacterium]
MPIIDDIPAEDRPREKVINHGSQYLTDSELLAIILRTSGIRGVSVLDIAREMLKKAGSLRSLAQMRTEELISIKGIGTSKAVSIRAVFEIAQRHEAEMPQKKIVFKTPDDIARRFMSKFRDKKREIFTVLLFDSKHRLLKEEAISVGTLMRVLVEPREVFAPAILNRAFSIILMHNHPSGDPTPSHHDEVLTKKIIDAGKVLNIPVLDHIILGSDSFYSFRENGKIG